MQDFSLQLAQQGFKLSGSSVLVPFLIDTV